MKPIDFSNDCAVPENEMDVTKIHVLEPGKEMWDVVHQLANNVEQEEAFYVLDVGDVIRKHKEWKLKLPRVQPFYAVKCNDSRIVLETLASLGANFDCASKSELGKVLDLGIDPERIIFANPTKQVSHVRYACSSNVRTMTFDNETELYKIKEHHPTAKMVLRFRCDAKKVQCPLGIKFGALPKDAPRLISLARQLDIDLVGVSFHVGSGCDEPEVFNRAIKIGRELFDLAATYGYNMTLFDLGGGYPGNRGSSISEIATIINGALDEYFPDGCGVDIIAEPGRYYVASAFTLATRIFGRRQLSNDDDDSMSYFYYINDGVYGSFNCMLYDHATVTPLLLEPRPGPNYSSTIWGPTCDGLDQIASNVEMPLMHVGDWMVFQDMGAYTLAAAGTFNGFPVPKVCAVAQPHTWLFLKERSPYTDSHFTTLESPKMMMKSADLPIAKRFNVLPSNMSSASLDTDHSDDVSSASDSENYSSNSLEFLTDLLDVATVM